MCSTSSRHVTQRSTSDLQGNKIILLCCTAGHDAIQQKWGVGGFDESQHEVQWGVGGFDESQHGVQWGVGGFDESQQGVQWGVDGFDESQQGVQWAVDGFDESQHEPQPRGETDMEIDEQ